MNNSDKKEYSNPLPIIVLLVPVIGKGVLVQKREINPAKGKLALISGYMEKGETPQETAIREAKEECGLSLTNITFRGFKVSGKKDLLILLESDPISESSINFTPNEEVSEISFVCDKSDNGFWTDLAFPAHTEFLNSHFVNAKLSCRKSHSGW